VTAAEGLRARQRYALLHPYSDPKVQDIGQYRSVDAQRDGNLLVSILAVDR